MCGPELMDFQRTLLIGTIAVVGVLTLQQWNEDYPGTPKSASVAHSVSSSQAGSDMPSLKDGSSIPSTDDGAAKPSAQLISVKTNTIDALIDPAGGDIISLTLPQYPAWLPEDGEPTVPFQLLVNSPDCQGEITCVFTAQSALAKTDGPDANNLRGVYQVKQANYTLEDGENKLTVDLHKNMDGVDITKSFTFYRNRYDVTVNYTIVNNSDKVWRDQFYAQLKRDNSEDPSQLNSKAPMNTYLGAAVRSNDEPYAKLPFDEISDKPFAERVQGGYAAMLQHYFVSAWVPDQQKAHQYYTKQNKDGYNFVGFYDDAMVVQPGETIETGATLYVGPKNQENLKSLSDGLELTVDYGMLWFLAQPLFTILKWIHSLVGNWGWSIILLTVLVKAVFYPLNATSFRSMAKMRKLGPKLQEMKEKYGDDRQKMSQAMMELYKKEKVNPMGGCLPILVQMPVFIALYWTLLESVELRQAPWLGWIHDLSQMDPYFILPLIMGASMFIQQMLNPTPPDPVQAKVMKMMPVIFTFFFLFFPAGLVLYWVTNNVLSIIQQYIITKKIEKEG
ncbi:membrane protein insertase YidC [Endozoicomonas sp. SCSIO W0465]|uniref:membrane protein insertase YidC n=1 Tax=Endozoicomonas sp. SCSIO W0465 TaxID=2918516 RepID=UPI0035324DB6